MEKLDVNYFYGPLTIPQVTDQAVARNLAYYFATYEIPFLKLLLGEALFQPLLSRVAQLQYILACSLEKRYYCFQYIPTI